MFNQEELSKAHFNQFESLLRLAHISLAGVERIVRLQLDASRQSLEENGKLVRELSQTTDPQQAAQQLNKVTASAVEQVVNHSRNLYEVVSEVQTEVARLTEEQIGQYNKSLISTIDTLAKNAPAGSDSAINAVKSGIAASAAAVNSLTKAAQQVSDFAGSSVKAATTATADAVKSNAKKASSSQI
ncbi:MAG: phasin family protein [Microvirgula sp.]